MPRGRKKQQKLNIKPETAKSLFALGLILVAFLSFVALFTDNGSLLAFVGDTQNNIFGYSSFLFSLIILLLALLMFESLKDSKFIQIRVLLGFVLMLASLSGLMSALGSESTGGVLGSFISSFFIEAITTLGAILVLFTVFVISFIVILDIPFDQVISFLFSIFAKLKDSIKLPSLPQKQTVAESEMEFANDYMEPQFDFNPPATMSKHTEIPQPLNEEKFEIIPTVSEPTHTKNSNKKAYDIPKDIVSKISANKPKSINSELPAVESIASAIPRLPYSDRVWEYPPADLLQEPSNTSADRGDVRQRQLIIEKTLASFGIKARVAEINYGPSITQYALETSSGTKIAKITNLQNDIALALASPTGSVRIEAPIPGKSLIGIEVPNISTAMVSFKSVFTSDVMRAAKSKLTVALGHNVSGLPYVADIAKMPHVLIAGSTGSGKSVFLHSILFSLLYRCSPAECKLIMIDPKRVELINYNDIPHLLVPVVTDAEKAPNAFKWAVLEMERRYKLFENARVRHLTAYNELSGFQALPYIVIIVDELAELMALQPGDMEKSICRLAQLSRATGIHLVLATQSPRVDVITGLIKANIPTRVAFGVSSQVESRIILDTIGAEKLLGKGDMLYVPPDTSKPTRIQGVFVSDKEISNLVDFLKNSGVSPEYKDDILKPQVTAKQANNMESTDELFEEAVNLVSLSDKASASLLQRKFSIGYARAARLLDELEAKGIVGPADGSKPREVLRRSAGDSIMSLALEDE